MVLPAPRNASPAAIIEHALRLIAPATIDELCAARRPLNRIRAGHEIQKMVRAGRVRRLDFGLFELAKR